MSSITSGRAPLVARSGDNLPSASSASSVRFAKEAASDSKSRSSSAGSGAPKVIGMPSFSVLSSGMPSSILAEELIMRGAKKKPVAGQTINTFYHTITHLHLGNCRLLGDIAAVTLCKNLRVLYVYENRLTSLGGLGGLERLSHLYAQDNRIESLDDFEAPPNLTQLHLGGNRLREISGLDTCRCLAELHLAGQAPPAEAAVEEEEEEEENRGAPPPAKGGIEPSADDAAAMALAPRAAAIELEAEESEQPLRAQPAGLTIAPESLMAIAPTLQKLVVSSCGLDDDALEPFVVLQGLTALDARANRLASLGRLQQLLLRLPVLQTLAIEGNGALCDAPKLRERLIVASASLATLDARPIKQNERAFLMTLAMRQQQQQQSASASASRTAGADGAAAGSAPSSASSAQRVPTHRGRPQQLGVSIPSAQSFDLGARAGLLRGETPAGFMEQLSNPDEGHRPKGDALMSGARRPWARQPHMA